jgi:transposase
LQCFRAEDDECREHLNHVGNASLNLRNINGFSVALKPDRITASPQGRGPAPAKASTPAASSIDIDPLAWLAEVLARIASTPRSRLPELLPWEWKKLNRRAAA